jgi:hypothetical protein
MSRPSAPVPPREDDEIDEMEEDDEMEMGDDEMEMDMFDALGNLLATEDGETVATTLASLKDATEKIALNLEMQNKILVKILTAITKLAPPQVAGSA